MRIIKILLGLHFALLVALALPAGAILIDHDGATGSLSGDVGGTALLFGVDGSALQGIGNSKVFLTINQTGNNTTEEGYNTDGTVEFETIDSGTTSLLLTDIPQASYGGTLYYEFAFALNQTGGSDQISINEITIMQGDSATMTGYNPAGPNIGGSSLAFDWTYDPTIDGSGHNQILTIEDFVPGLSDVEMLMLVEEGSFNDKPYVMLYMNAGNPISANGGNDKWLVFENAATPVPEPETMLLLGTGLIGLVTFGRKKFFKK